MTQQPVEIFENIAPTYDRTNRILSGGVDLYWRRKMVALLPSLEKIKLLDLATGTGDQLLAFLKHSSKIDQAVGIDLAEEMLKIGRTKLKAYDQVTLKKASATDIPFPGSSYDCIAMSFGIRNVDNVPKCLREIHRVLRPKGRALILEFSLPTNKWVQKTYLFYLNKLLPTIGKLISAHEHAYTYLAQTIQSFPQAKTFCTLMEEVGFTEVKAHPLTFGIVTIYQGEK